MLLKDFASRLAAVQTGIKDQETRLKNLKRHAANQRKSQEKKRKLLEENQEVVKYDTPGRPPLLYQYPNLHDHIHSCIEFGEARVNRSLAARAHHHPALVGIAGVNRDEKKDHIDGHYCLAAVGRHFETMQSVRESVSVADHDFPIGSSQKLVPSVYLMINPKEGDDYLFLGN